jgi:hypothetical protein
MGSPLADDVKHVDVDSIFFFFPYMLAVRKLKKYHLWNDIDEEWRREINVTHGSKSKLQARRDHMREVFATGREFFTWERGLLCPVCFHFWLTLFVWALFIQDAILISALFYLANHFLIRKIS